MQYKKYQKITKVKYKYPKRVATLYILKRLVMWSKVEVHYFN